MESKRKKTLFNVIMVVLILVIAGCGVMAVGNLKGWFDKGSDSILVSRNVKGVANIQRSGVGYGLEKNVSLREGDILETKNGSTAELLVGDRNILSLNANTKLTAESVKKDSLKLTADQGEVFGDFTDSVGKTELSFDENTRSFETGDFCVSVQSGSGSVYVFKDELELNGADGSDITVNAGESVQMTQDENGSWTIGESIKVSPGSLNEYMINQLLNCDDKDSLCFTAEELQKVLDDRAAEKKAALEKSLASANKIPKKSDSSASSDEEKDKTTKNPETSGNSENAANSGDAAVSEYAPETSTSDDTSEGVQDNGDTSIDEEYTQDGNDGDITSDGSGGTSYDSTDVSGDGTADDNGSGSTDNSGNDSADNSGNDNTDNSDSSTDTTEDTKQCTITIRCDTILDNMDNLTSGKEAYVPSNGVILDTSTVEFTEGETVFDVLQRVCEYAGIQLEYSWTPMYDSYYVQGINNLYEFDCGAQSGWMYKVNGWFPNYGCSKYTLEDGDDIVWCFTCNGLGEDVGAEYNG